MACPIGPASTSASACSCIASDSASSSASSSASACSCIASDLASSSALGAGLGAGLGVVNVLESVPFPTLETLAGPAPLTTLGTLVALTLGVVGTMGSLDTGTPPSVGPTIGFALALSLLVCPSGAP